MSNVHVSYSMNSVALIWVNFSYIYEMNAHYAGILYRHVKNTKKSSICQG